MLGPSLFGTRKRYIVSIKDAGGFCDDPGPDSIPATGSVQDNLRTPQIHRAHQMHAQ